MKRFITILILFGLLSYFGGRVAHAQTGMKENFNSQNVSEIHGESLDSVLRDLLSNQNVNSIQELDCDSITDSDLESLGDAVMSKQHPDAEIHERMDEMMGGEGSESLRQAHMNMGSSYLGCSYKGGDMGMPALSGVEGVGGGMMGQFGQSAMGGATGVSPMVSGFISGLFGLNQLLGLLVSISLIAFLLTGARWFWKKGGK